MKALIFGCGYLGERVACRWRDGGHDVFVVTRSPERAAALERERYRAIVADVTKPDTLRSLQVADCVLCAVGFDRQGGQSIHEIYANGVQNVLAALPADAKRFIYISTTGVYGPANGDWVDEVTPTDPRREGGRASLAAEQIIAAHPMGKRSVVLRLAGIYGPGRVPFLKELRAGEPIAAPATGWLNLIHVEDAATVVVATAVLPLLAVGPQIYCVSDGTPVERAEFYSEVARQ